MHLTKERWKEIQRELDENRENLIVSRKTRTLSTNVLSEKVWSMLERLKGEKIENRGKFLFDILLELNPEPLKCTQCGEPILSDDEYGVYAEDETVAFFAACHNCNHKMQITTVFTVSFEIETKDGE